MTITQLEYVIALARLRSFARAAEECHVSQPTLSMQVKKLEEGLGQILFDRSQAPVTPTPVGERFIAQALKVLHEYRLLGETARDPGPLTGSFKLGIIPGLAPYLLPLFLGEFHRKYPLVQLAVEELQTHLIVEKLKADELDAGLLATPLKDPGIVERVLFYEEFRALLSPGHPLLTSKKIDQDDLKGQSLWLLDEGHCLRNQVLKFCGIGKGRELRLTGGSLETIKNLTRSGQYMTVLPEMALKDSPEDLIRDFKAPVPVREISLIHARSFLREKHIDALEKVVLERLPDHLQAPKKGTKLLKPF